MFPEVFDNLIFLNLHLRLWDSYIAIQDVKPPLSGRQNVSCGNPPSCG